VRNRLCPYWSAEEVYACPSRFKGFYVVSRWLGVTLPVREGAVSSPLALLTAMTALTGLCLPKAHDALRRVRKWLRQGRMWPMKASIRSCHGQGA
jgi:hypothetical protein